MTMNKNERKLVLALAKGLVHQLDINMRLINMLPDDKAADIQPHQNNLESEIQAFIKIIDEEWRGNGQG